MNITVVDNIYFILLSYRKVLRDPNDCNRVETKMFSQHDIRDEKYLNTYIYVL